MTAHIQLIKIHIKMIFYAILFNSIAESHNWFKNIFKEVLANSFDITMESQITTIVIEKNSF